jgi:hypothetical protein
VALSTLAPVVLNDFRKHGNTTIRQISVACYCHGNGPNSHGGNCCPEVVDRLVSPTPQSFFYACYSSGFYC